MSSHPVNKPGLLRAYLSEDKTIRASVVVMTDLVQQVCDLQTLSPTSSVALGRLLVGSVLVASQLKDDQAISLQVSGSEQIKKIFAHAQYDGLCRAFISEKQAPLSIENNGISLKSVIGSGYLVAMTYIPKYKQPQISQVELLTSEIGDDIAYYLNQSCQIPCLVSLAVKVGAEGQIRAAGGVIVELMPGHTEETLKQIERTHSQAQSLSHLIEQNADYSDLLANHVGHSFNFSEIRNNEVNYGCTCSKDKASQSLFLLNVNDFVEILDAREDLQVDCEMCGITYTFNFEEINLIYKRSGKAQIH